MKSLLLFLLLLSPSLALAQQPVQTFPAPASTLGANASGTIASTGVFQKVFTANSLRRGCTIQNNGAAVMEVNEGTALASATTSNTYVIPASGGVWHCTDGGVVLTGEVDITGTTTQAFYAVQY